MITFLIYLDKYMQIIIISAGVAETLLWSGVGQDSDPHLGERDTMKLSARNIIKGRVADLGTDSIAAQVQVDIGGGNLVTSTITKDSAERLGLSVGKDVAIVIKASDVMLAVDD